MFKITSNFGRILNLLIKINFINNNNFADSLKRNHQNSVETTQQNIALFKVIFEKNHCKEFIFSGLSLCM